MSRGLLSVKKFIEDEEMRLDRERSAIEDLGIRECDDMECERLQDQYHFISARIHQMKVFKDMFEMEYFHEIKAEEEAERE